jgi:hypothetical protein
LLLYVLTFVAESGFPTVAVEPGAHRDLLELPRNGRLPPGSHPTPPNPHGSATMNRAKCRN